MEDEERNPGDLVAELLLMAEQRRSNPAAQVQLLEQ